MVENPVPVEKCKEMLAKTKNSRIETGLFLYNELTKTEKVIAKQRIELLKNMFDITDGEFEYIKTQCNSTNNKLSIIKINQLFWNLYLLSQE